MTPATQTEPLRREIEQYAYFLYEQRGCQPGRELEDWLEAERHLMSSVSDGAQTNPAQTDAEAQQSSPRSPGQAKRPNRKTQSTEVY